MDIAFHIGANCTDEDRLLRSVTKNLPNLAGRGTRVPNPARYRRLLRETIQHLRGGSPEPDTRDVLIDAILDHGETTERLVLGNPAFICTPARICEAGCFHELAGFKARSLAALFPEDRIEMFLGIRNPASFLPACWEQARGRGFDEFMAGLDPRTILWSDVVARLRQAAPEARLTVWCDEDSALIWPELVRALAGLDEDAPVEGGLDLVDEIMRPEGAARLRDYLASHPPANAAQQRRVVSAFLDKYARAEVVETEIDLPGWDTALLADLTAIYEADLQRIAAMEGVRFLAA
ncbi:hypothetical protein FHS00_003507 [Limimaricola variabilis]|uniref:Sulfotransferase family protein n=1 Tax=Limimaricola variabilis TaxID=1492771 RepID=A0ABR6HTZ1_9RHOB|nr:hypothetical protein [Limimaricola variabilis]MBB3713900.1 hypothetical protein [Limimaricola variabilis]